jgi:aldehyde:ferredoxin oxidoreductase
VFFDIENNDETAFFNSMAVNLELKLTNTSNFDRTYTVTFNTTKKIVNGDNEEAVSNSYVACYFSNIPYNYAENKKISSLETNTTSYAYTNNSTSYSAVYSSDEYALKASTLEITYDESTLNLYLIGVQELNTSKNTDCLYTESDGE